MPAKNDRQRRALAAKFGWEWVKEHHFDVVNPEVYENNRAMGMTHNHPKKRRHKRRR